MPRHCGPRTLLAVGFALVGALATAGAPAALAADACPNATLRIGASAALPECRAYELVSPDANHAALGLTPSGLSSTGGNSMIYQVIDAPDNAQSASTFNVVRATRDPARGWSGVSLAPPVKVPQGAFTSSKTWAFAKDFTTSFVISDQPLTSDAQTGANEFVGSNEKGYQLLTPIPTPVIGFVDIYPPTDFSWGNSDFSNVYFNPAVAQLSSDPLPAGNTYAWSRSKGLRLVGILPDGTPAPGASLSGGLLQPASEDGSHVLFRVADPNDVDPTDGSQNELYLRNDDAHTIDLGSITITGGDPTRSDATGITADGSTVLFSSRAELTGDANTGPSQQGRDLYKYDTASGHLSDLTVDAGDVNGATVRNVLGVAADGSRIYFTADGNLAAGHTPGQRSLYVWHDGRIDFLANGDGINPDASGSSGFYTTPDGGSFLFASSDRLTDYDNFNPATNTRALEVYKATLGSGITCMSCRPDGSPPTSNSVVPVNHSIPGGPLRAMSDNGQHAFFQSADAILPQASGLQQVYENVDGKVLPLSRIQSPTPATFLDTSASGDDVFIATTDDLVPSKASGDLLVYDVRVGGGAALPPGSCSGSACHPEPTLAPALPTAASVTFAGPGNAGPPAARTAAATVSVAKVRSVKGAVASLTVKVPGRGRLTISGSGLQTKRSSLGKAQTVTIRLALTSSAATSLRKHRSFKTKAKVGFAGAGGQTSATTLSLTFKATSTRKGR
jgi:hypothetical protein